MLFELKPHRGHEFFNDVFQVIPVGEIMIAQRIGVAALVLGDQIHYPNFLDTANHASTG